MSCVRRKVSTALRTLRRGRRDQVTGVAHPPMRTGLTSPVRSGPWSLCLCQRQAKGSVRGRHGMYMHTCACVYDLCNCMCSKLVNPPHRNTTHLPSSLLRLMTAIHCAILSVTDLARRSHDSWWQAFYTSRSLLSLLLT